MVKDKYPYSILVIEDNSGDFLLIEDSIEDIVANPKIQHCKTYLKAHDVLAAKEAAFDVILLDLSLPDKTGEELIKDIVTLAEDVPVIVLTGYSDMEFSVRSLSLGIADYLLKDDINSNVLYKSIVYNIERQKINNQLKESEKQLLKQKLQENKKILKAIVSAQERERTDLGAELHDNVNQILAAASLYLNFALTQEKDHSVYIEKGKGYISEAIEEIRKLTKALVGPSSKEKSIGLVPTIQELLNDLSVVKKATFIFNHSSFKEEDANEELKLVIFRIIQEQLNNIFKHANATEIIIYLNTNDQQIELLVIDNGKGFNVSSKRKGIGLINIENRAALHNGKVEILSSPGAGCKLKVLFERSTFE